MLGANTESQFNVLKDMDPNIEAIEITVTPDMSNLGNLIADIEQTIQENKKFKEQITLDLANRANAEPGENDIEVAQNRRKDIIIKRGSKIALIVTVLFGLMLSFIVLVSNIGEAKEIWPQTVQFNNTMSMKLNVGGMKDIEVNYTTLVSIPNSKLAQTFSKPQQVQEGGTVFVNRAHIPFKLMLHYLRNELEIPDIKDKYEQEIFLQELEFWGIPERKQTTIEQQLEKMLGMEPSHPLLIKNVVDQWKVLKPFDLKFLVNNETVAIDENYEINTLDREEVYQFKGQAHFEVGHGVGRVTGGFGMYEGQYLNGFPNGYGRIIWRNKNYYVGYFENGLANGNGTYTYQSRKIDIEGIWQQGSLIQSFNPDSMKNFRFPEPSAPEVSRLQSPEERDLINQLNNLKIEPFAQILARDQPLKYAQLINNQDYKDQIALSETVLNLNTRIPPTGVKELLDQQLYGKFDSSKAITTMVNENFVFNGQIEETSANPGRRLQTIGATSIVAKGIGKMYGTWGFYTGEIKNGIINGYGRMIWPTGALYQGEWSNGKLQGAGRWVMPNLTEVNGNWENGTLILSIQYDKMEGFTPPEVIPLPKITRPVSALELELSKIFKETPSYKNLALNVTQQWTKLGKWNMETFISSGKIVLNQSWPITYDSTGIYKGQSVFQEKLTNIGIGRLQGPWGLYEGQSYDKEKEQRSGTKTVYGRMIFSDTLESYQGTIIEGKTLSPNGTLFNPDGSVMTDQQAGGSVKDRIQQKNMLLPGGIGVDGIRIIGEKEGQLDSIYSEKLSSDLSPEINAAWEQAGPYDISGLVSNGSVFIDETNSIGKDLTGKYQGQGSGSADNFTGFGRYQNGYLYEGQFKNGKMDGNGRIIYPNGTIQQGIFKDGKYLARNQFEVDLMDLFSKSPSNEKVSEVWKSQGVFDLVKYLDEEKITYNDIATQTIQRLDKKQSFGNQLYQGQGEIQNFQDGKNFGPTRMEQNVTSSQTVQNLLMEGTTNFSRVIYENGDVYTGGVLIDANGGIKQNDKNGLNLMGDGRVQEGVFNDGKFTGRTQSTNEVKMKKMFARVPWSDKEKFYRVNLETDKVNTWTTMGPFNIDLVYKQYKTKEEKDTAYAKLEKATIGRIISREFEYTGVLNSDKLNESDILGRIQFTWGLYEGQIQNGQSTGFGRTIYNNGDVYQGYHLNGLPDTSKPGVDAYDSWALGQPNNQNFTLASIANKSWIPSDPKNSIYIGRELTDVEWQLNQIFAQKYYKVGIKPLKEKYFITPEGIEQGNAGVFSLPIGNFPLSQLLNEGKMTIVALKNEIQSINSDIMRYNGQVNKGGNVLGLGRLDGVWGTFEGEYLTPTRTAYGRMIFDINSFYEGEFVNMIFNGQGKYGKQDPVTKIWTFYEGLWKDGKLVESANATSIGFEFTKIDITMSRDKSELEKDLIQIFANDLISEVPQTTVDKWKKLGPFQVSQAIDQEKLTLQEQYGIGKDLTLRYIGQYEVNNAGESSGIGIGRQQAKWGLHEGNIEAGGLATGYGRVIWPNGDSYTGMFKEGKFDGQGTYTLANGTSESGDWTQGNHKPNQCNWQCYVNRYKNITLATAQFDYESQGKANGQDCKCSVKEEFNQLNDIPSVPTFKSQMEFDLMQLFASKPNVTDDIMKTYEIMGTFDIENLMNNQTIVLDGSNLIINKTDGSYQGQVTNDFNEITREGNMEGVGRLFDATRGLYEGEFSNGQYSGHGRLITASGEVYIGSFNDGTFYGKGILVKDGKVIKEGYFAYNVYLGSDKTALLKFNLQQIFEKQVNKEEFRYLQESIRQTWIKAKPFNYTLADSLNLLIIDPAIDIFNVQGNLIKYEGQAKDQVPYGIGRKYYFTELKEGQFKDDALNGFGRNIWNNDTYYQGMWKMDKQNGQGKLVSSNGSVLEGIFENGVYQYSLNQFQIQEMLNTDAALQENVTQSEFWKKAGPFSLNNLTKSNKITFDDSLEMDLNGTVVEGKYKGQYQGSKTNYTGIGRLNTQSELYEGEFKNGEYNGQGRLIDFQGKGTWIGSFKNGKPDGLNVFTSTNGTVSDSYWVNGEILMSRQQWELQLLMASEPKYVESQTWVIKRWETYNKESTKFDLQKLVNSNKIEFSPQYPINNLVTYNSRDNIHEGQILELGSKIAQGVGRELFKKGQYWEGNWDKDLPRGYARILYIEGHLYSGNVIDGKRSGEGTLISSDYNYTGGWENDIINGIGTQTFPNGTIIKGYFKNGAYSMSENLFKLTQIFGQSPDGKDLSKEVLAKWKNLGAFNLTEPITSGKLIVDELINAEPIENINASTTFEGQKQENSYVGRMINTGLYEGMFKDNEINGFGRVIFQNQDYYIGMMVNGEPDGVGDYFYANGTQQSGFFKQGQWQMSLTQYDLTKIFTQTPDYKDISPEVIAKWKQLGIFNITEYRNKGYLKINDTNPVSQIMFSDSTYFGQKANDQYDGLGRRQSDQLQEGVYVKGLMEGFGRIIYPNMLVYEGFFKDHKKFGEGTLTYPNGNVKYGSWDDDNFKRMAEGTGVLDNIEGQ